MTETNCSEDARIRVMLGAALDLYGKSHRNSEYCCNSSGYKEWFRNTLNELNLAFQSIKTHDFLECYKLVKQYIEEDRFFNKTTRSLLILGGTGIVGQATAREAVKKRYDVTVTGIEDNPALPEEVDFVHASQQHKLSKEWDVVFEIYNFEKGQTQQTYEMFRERAHIIIMSTTLTYDRTGYSFKPIKSNHDLSELGTQGGYVDKKIELERFWQSKQGANWTLIRPYHILGPGSLLGCLPPHNRDPCLVERIRSGKIRLCDGGRVPLNIIHADDIGKVVLKIAGNPKTFRKAYNVVNPQEIIARDYYLEIAKAIDSRLTISNMPGEHIWAREDWRLTTLPHLYDISDLEEDIGPIKFKSLEESIKDTLDNLPESYSNKKSTPVSTRMNQEPSPSMNRYFSSKPHA